MPVVCFDPATRPNGLGFGRIKSQKVCFYYDVLSVTFSAGLRPMVKYRGLGPPWMKANIPNDVYFPVFAAKTMNRTVDLPDPDQLPGGDVVIFDGECNFCRSQVSNLRRLDWGGKRLSFISLHDPRVAERYPDLTHDQMMEQMYVIDAKGNKHGGGDAVRYLSRRLPLLWITAPILHVPGSARLWRWLYGQVAKRRYKLAGKSCEDDVCSVHMK